MRKLYIFGFLVVATIAGLYSTVLLLANHGFGLTLSSLLYCDDNIDLELHLLIIGLLPIYIGVIIFGSELAGIYLTQAIQKRLNKNKKNTSNKKNKTTLN